jgi:hypothetical protein
MKNLTTIFGAVVAGTVLVPLVATRYHDLTFEQLLAHAAGGAVMGSVVGVVLVFLDRMGGQLSPDDLASIRNEAGLTALEIIAVEPLVPFWRHFAQPGSEKIVREDELRNVIPLALHGRRGDDEVYIVNYDTPDEHTAGASMLMGLLSGGIKFPLAFFIFPGSARQWPKLTVEPRKAPRGDAATALESFKQCYRLWSGTAVIDWARVTDWILPDELMEHLSRDATWTLRVEGGDLCLWQKTTWGINAKSLPSLLSQALEIRDLLAKSEPRR